ncbi:Sodium-coupled monocarboxylate transporter 2 [Armadillidium vulgare]|nr:Sodium-coupled monocarboxylate transporter 2 [Armadillidium vulgare]
MENENGFGVADYSVFAGVLVISCGIGLYFSYKGNKSPEEFFMGNRILHPLPVSMSLLTTLFSSLSMLGFAAEAYANGMQLSMFILGVVFAIIFSSYLIMPILYPLKLTSINEYIFLRFKSKRLRICLTFITVTRILIVSGFSLYATTIVLASITKLNTMANIFLLGIVCSTYSAFGGIRAVVWTDFFQMFVMVLGMIIVIIVGCALSGGFIETLMSLSPFVRHTFFNTLIYGFINYSRIYGVEQYCVQRIYSVKSFKNARKVLTYNILGISVLVLPIFVGGLVAFANYVGCDPMVLGIIKKKDQIMPYFVTDKLSFILAFRIIC